MSDDRWCRDVAGAAILDFDGGMLVAARRPQACLTEIDYVTGMQPGRAPHRNTVMQHLGTFGRLHEQLVFVQPEIRFGAGWSTGKHDTTARAADRQWEVSSGKRAVPERFANDQSR